MSKRGTSNNILFYPINRVLKKKRKENEEGILDQASGAGETKGAGPCMGKKRFLSKLG